MSSAKRKAEDSADGCRAFERDDRKRAAASSSDHMRAVFERSAEAWSERARLLDRLEKDFNARAATAAEKPRRKSRETEDHG
jgi:hypothetical protein